MSLGSDHWFRRFKQRLKHIVWLMETIGRSVTTWCRLMARRTASQYGPPRGTDASRLDWFCVSDNCSGIIWFVACVPLFPIDDPMRCLSLSPRTAIRDRRLIFIAQCCAQNNPQWVALRSTTCALVGGRESFAHYWCPQCYAVVTKITHNINHLYKQ